MRYQVQTNSRLIAGVASRAVDFIRTSFYDTWDQQKNLQTWTIVIVKHHLVNIGRKDRTTDYVS